MNELAEHGNSFELDPKTKDILDTIANSAPYATYKQLNEKIEKLLEKFEDEDEKR
ncbi:MAG: hypothetical protein HWN67_08290 [Candidatus Helarchaeota archaeon]|nr:hypothetical protein [Candidatus Helarchaeota archaeon]